MRHAKNRELDSHLDGDPGFSIERLLEQFDGKAIPVAGALNLTSMNLLYQVLNPEKYGFPAKVFDVRYDMAERLAEITGTQVDQVRQYYITRWVRHRYAKRETDDNGSSPASS